MTKEDLVGFISQEQQTKESRRQDRQQKGEFLVGEIAAMREELKVAVAMLGESGLDLTPGTIVKGLAKYFAGTRFADEHYLRIHSTSKKLNFQGAIFIGSNAISFECRVVSLGKLSFEIEVGSIDPSYQVPDSELRYR